MALIATSVQASPTAKVLSFRDKVARARNIVEYARLGGDFKKHDGYMTQGRGITLPIALRKKLHELVKQMQTFLIRLGYGDIVEKADGYYGDKTAKAIAMFKKEILLGYVTTALQATGLVPAQFIMQHTVSGDYLSNSELIRLIGIYYTLKAEVEKEAEKIAKVLSKQLAKQEIMKKKDKIKIRVKQKTGAKTIKDEAIEEVFEDVYREIQEKQKQEERKKMSTTQKTLPTQQEETFMDWLKKQTLIEGIPNYIILASPLLFLVVIQMIDIFTPKLVMKKEKTKYESIPIVDISLQKPTIKKEETKYKTNLPELPKQEKTQMEKKP